MAKRIDWQHGEKLWRLGQLSANQIGKIIGCATSTVIRHMEANNVQRDHAEIVRQKTKEALVAKQEREDAIADRVQRKTVEITEEDIDEAVNANVALVMSHRRDLQRLAGVEQKLLGELEGEPTKLYLSTYQGNIVEKEVGLTVTERSSALLSLSGVITKRIEKQRQAFGLDDDNDRGAGDKVSDLTTDELLAIIKDEGQ